MQKRIQDRKKRLRSKAPRATSVTVPATGLNNTLPLNFDDQNKMKEVDIDEINLGKPILQSSSMLIHQQANAIDMNDTSQNKNDDDDENHPPVVTSPVKYLNLSKSRIDDKTSQGNRSTTTTGGGLASKIGQAMSRILQNSSTVDQTQDADDVQELMTLLDELNLHSDLTVKLSNQSKIIKFLNEASDGSNLKKNQGPIVKDYKKEIGKAKSEFGKLGFQSKLRLEMK